ncbi:MAG: YhbD family protein [Bacteroidota bacterium]
MENELISKKELLDLTGISYGQLYRWKRKNLIPEEWFVRKSTFTGQETFFPKESMLARIDKIKNMKEDRSLDDIAGMVSPALAQAALTAEEIIDRKIVSQSTLNSYFENKDSNGVLSFQVLLALFVLERLLQSGDVGIGEAKSAVKTMEEGYGRFEGKGCDLVVIRKAGISLTLLAPTISPIQFEEGIKIVARVGLERCAEELKMLAS